MVSPSISHYRIVRKLGQGGMGEVYLAEDTRLKRRVVRKFGNRLRITAQLINAADGYHLWSERYDREMKDIFDVQDEIAVAVVEALKVKLLGAKKAAMLEHHTDNTEAYQLYLKGRYHANRFTAVLACVYAELDRKDEAQTILATLTAKSNQQWVAPYQVARAYVRLDQGDQAFVWLEKAFAEYDEWIQCLKVDSALDRLRSDPRYGDLLRRIGLPQ